MSEVSRVGVTESDDEIELSLELSIGGSYKKLEKSLEEEEEEEEEKAIQLPRSGLSFPPTPAIVGDKVETESGSGSEVVLEVEDYYSQRNKKEIQALRRQEARRKREVKLRKSASNSNSNNVVGEENADYKMLLETQQLQSRVRDREMRENDALVEDRRKHKFEECIGNEKNGSSSNTIIKDSNFVIASRNINGGVTDGSQEKHHQGSGTKPPPSPVSVSSLQNNVPHCPQFLQCATQKNGFAHPHHNHMVESCLGRQNLGKDENGSSKGKNVISQPVSFRPYPNGIGNGNLKRDSGTGTRGDSEENSGKCGREIPKVMSSNVSPEKSSSAVSDYRSTSRKGGGSSSESGGSHSSSIGANEQQQCGVSLPILLKPETIVSEKKDLGRQEGGGRRGSAEAQKPSLPRMPCVTTTGNGPNGKTITGFLYRYTKTEVSIVCVCHGTSFSPAEFVEHAGGVGATHVTNPLRHITMVPSPFGD